MNRIYLVLLLSSISLISCQQKQAEEPVNQPEPEPVAAEVQNSSLVTPAKLEQLVENGAILIDVRTPGEISGGYIEGATHIDFQEGDFRQKLGALDKGQTYVVYCAVGGRSKTTQQYMASVGFKSVFDLDGGIRAWQKAGKLVVK